MSILDKIQSAAEISDRWQKDIGNRTTTPDLSIQSLPMFNEKIFGLRRRELVTIGARTSQGKTSFVCQLAFDFASAGKPVLYLSLEDSEDFIMERIFCNLMKVDNQMLAKGQTDIIPMYDEKMNMFKELITTIPLQLCCGIGKTFKEVNELIQNLTVKPHVIIVDYIQAIKSTKEREDINEYIREFRELAIKHDFCGILCSQLNRSGVQMKQHYPDMSQLKSTGVLEEHSDKVILLFWKHHYDESADLKEFHIIVSKNKKGKTGSHVCEYLPWFYKFEEIKEVL